mmetsp:Transcript_32946/g.63292  ORF Transcript_32946/g.63292 Transcript_32946/m.63292 type:complete len:388 (+) Transcript_32946:183-1346(+)
MSYTSQNDRGGGPREHRGFRGTAENAKTVLCTRFVSPEGCRFGDRCNFAHGDTELQPRKARQNQGSGYGSQQGSGASTPASSNGATRGSAQQDTRALWANAGGDAPTRENAWAQGQGGYNGSEQLARQPQQQRPSAPPAENPWLRGAPGQNQSNAPQPSNPWHREQTQVVGGHVYQNNHIEKQQQAMSGTHNGAWGSGHNPLSSGVMHQSNTSHNQHQNPNNGFNHQVGGNASIPSEYQLWGGGSATRSAAPQTGAAYGGWGGMAAGGNSNSSISGGRQGASSGNASPWRGGSGIDLSYQLWGGGPVGTKTSGGEQYSGGNAWASDNYSTQQRQSNHPSVSGIGASNPAYMSRNSDHGWTQHNAPDGTVYYYNSFTQVSQWERPAEL